MGAGRDKPAERGQRFQAILEAYRAAADAGRAPDRQELLRRHPEFAADLSAFFAVEDQIRQVGRALPPPPSAQPSTLTESGPRPSERPPTTNSPPANKIHYFGDYELLEEIAPGGMGVVYKARQIGLNRPVALKMILSGKLASAAEVQRFRREAEAAANLDHPHIVPIYEVGEHQGQHY
jgi:hypothetical protein